MNHDFIYFIGLFKKERRTNGSTYECCMQHLKMENQKKLFSEIS